MNSPSTLFTRTASDEESHTLLPKAGGAAAKRSHHLAGVAFFRRVAIPFVRFPAARSFAERRHMHRLVVMAMAAGAGYSTIKAASRVATSFDAVEPVASCAEITLRKLHAAARSWIVRGARTARTRPRRGSSVGRGRGPSHGRVDI